MNKKICAYVIKMAFAVGLIFLNTNAAVDTAQPLSRLLPLFKTLANKYKLTQDDVSDFKAILDALKTKENQLTPEQIEIYREAVAMARYGMVYEAITAGTGDNWTAISAAAGKFAGTAAVSVTKPTTEDFSQWTAYLAGMLNQYKVLRAQTIKDKIDSGDLIAFAGAESIMAKIVELVNRRLEAPLSELKTAAGVSIAEKKPAANTEALEEGYQMLVSEAGQSFQKDLEAPAVSWATLKSVIQNAKAVAGLASNPTEGTLKNEATAALSRLEVDLNKPLTTAERLTAFVKLVAKQLIQDKVTFEIRLSKIIDGATSELSEADKKNIVDAIDQFCSKKKPVSVTETTEVLKGYFDNYVRAMSAGKKASDIFNAAKTYAFAWAEQDGSKFAQKYWQADKDSDATKITLIDDNPLKATCQFLIETDSNDASVVSVKYGTQYLKNDGTLGAKATDGSTTFFVFGSKDSLSLKNKASQGFVTVASLAGAKELVTEINGEPAGSKNDAGILEPGTWGVFKIMEITQLHKDLASHRDEWSKVTWTANSSDAKTSASNVKQKYNTTINALSNDPRKSTDANAELVIRELSAFITQAFRKDVKNWSWFNASGLSQEFSSLFDSVKNVFRIVLAQKGAAAKAMEEFDKLVSTPPDEVLSAIARNDNFDAKVDLFNTELQRYENNGKEEIKKLLEQKKLMPFTGEGSLVKAIMELLPRRMETALENLKTSSGDDISKNVNAANENYRPLKTSAGKFVIKALEDREKSFTNMRDLITKIKLIAYTDKAQIPLDQQKVLNNLFFELEKQISAPITTTERVLALKKLVETEAIKDSTALLAKEEFEVRLIKLIDSLSSDISDVEKKSLTDTIDRFYVVSKLPRDTFADYIRILTQGRQPSEIFGKDKNVAFLWAEQDGTEPVQKYWSAMNFTEATTATKAKFEIPSDGKAPNKIRLSQNDPLVGSSHFKVFVTDDSEVVLYAEFGGQKYVLKNDGTISQKDPKNATGAEKFYSYGSKESISFKSVEKAGTSDEGGFLSVDYDKTLKSYKGASGKEQPLGKKNVSGKLEPGAWGVFKIVDISPLHEELKTARANWFDKTWDKTQQSEADASIAEYRRIITEMDNSGVDTDFNVDLILREISGFVTKAFRGSPEQWDWCKSEGFNTKLDDLKIFIKKAFAEALGTNGQAVKAMAELEQNTTTSPEESIPPHEDAPKSGQLVTLFVDGEGGKEKYLRVVQERDATGEHFYLKNDMEDPVNPGCHLQVFAMGNKLGFGFKSTDGSVKVLQYVPRSESDLKRYWQDATGRAVIDRMARLEFLPAGKGDFNSKGRANEQFMMNYHNETDKNPPYLFSSIGEGAGFFTVNADGYAVVVQKDEASKKLVPTTKTDGTTSIKFLPISGFLTELGSLRTQKDVFKAISEYTSKVDLVETNQDLEFLILEFENFVEARQAVRKDWLDLMANIKFMQAVKGFVEKVAPKADGNAEIATALKNLKITLAQTMPEQKNIGTKTFAIKWLNSDGAPMFLMVDPQGNLTATSEGFGDSACHFKFDSYLATDADPMALTVKLLSKFTGAVSVAGSNVNSAVDDYLAQINSGSTSSSNAASSASPSSTQASTQSTSSTTGGSQSTANVSSLTNASSGTSATSSSATTSTAGNDPLFQLNVQTPIGGGTLTIPQP